ncbi:hypothetical protein KVMX100_120816 [Klebsiella variicola]|nr:hypothetical protein KVMX100_120816 [Klebsiella variicola]
MGEVLIIDYAIPDIQLMLFASLPSDT